MLRYILVFFLLIISSVYVMAENLLPYPQSIKYNGSFFVKYLQVDSCDSCNIIDYDIENLLGDQLSVKHIDDLNLGNNNKEAYIIEVNEDNVIVKSCTSAGTYYAFQTLKQLVKFEDNRILIPTCDIHDWPAFAIRGFMHDVGRSYISVSELKKQIKLLSLFKINVFHWHLTENQAWRLQSKKYPQLNSPENMTRLPGLFYTLEEAKDLIDFCKRHHVLLIPEIDMPGHSEAFKRTFNTDMQSEKGMVILKDLIDEICQAFDVPYIHIGTDEVSFTNPDFVPTMVKYIRAKGKKVISWNPGWKYSPGEIDMTQLWSYRGKPQPGIPAIDCRFHYLNHFDIYADLFALYNSRICNVEKGDDDIAGAILAVWNDRYIEDEKQILAENNFYANMLAFAERSWKGGGSCYFDGKGTMMWPENKDVNSLFEDFENRMLFYKKTLFYNEPFPYVRQSNVRWRITDPFPNDGCLSKVFPPEVDSESYSYTYNGKTYNTYQMNGAGVYLRHVWGDIYPGFYKNPKENHTAYAFSWIYSPIKQNVGINIDFQNYSRSESDLPPLQGTWDYKGSKIWLNGKEILPPVWSNNHSNRDNEIPLGNENSASRKPEIVTLNKGWNELLLKLPVGEFKMEQTRLVKWMFNIVFVSPDGREEVKNIIYSSDIPLTE